MVVSSNILDERMKDIRKRLGLEKLKPVYVPVVLCYPYHRTVKAEKMELCRPFVLQAIAAAQPKRILLMGANAVKQLYGKVSIRSLIGAELATADGVPITVTYDPSAALAGKPEYLVSIRKHIERMVAGLATALPPFPGWKKGG